MSDTDRDRLRHRAMLLQRASRLFDRYVTWVPFVIVYLKGWPTQTELSHMPTGAFWSGFVSVMLYWLAALALDRACAFARLSLDS